MREYLLESEPDEPEVPRVLLVALDWAMLKADDGKSLLRRLMRVPGAHTLVLWRVEELTYLGDGVRTDFRLPNGWTCACDSAPAPMGIELSRFDLVARLGAAGDPLPLSVKDAADYTGTPAPGELWRLRDGNVFRLGTPVPEGERLHVEVVPVYRVVRMRDDSRRRLEQPVLESYRLQLREAPL